ncbi:hypothetical protein [Thermobrachium celere]|uniref:Uncharacterized protein n=1 Tax=Thermobrachium celere DSM 8682 TaxID=941824 RepID=R7RV21_9CLOT|nr:hypothetical protein [Thermobrachium celere]CDF59456.1 conserved hypothetical protein [Thermobrachium celere DSM 8682]
MENNSDLLLQVGDAIKDLKTFSEISVLNICLLSGCGIIKDSDDNTVEKIFKHSDGSLHQLFDNTVVLQCIYKKAKPVFLVPTEDNINYGIYMWDYSSFNKSIKVETQCYAILSMLKLAEKYVEIYPHLSQLLIYCSSELYEFLSSFMRDENGLFVDVKNKTKSYDDKINLKINKNNIKLANQLLVFNALLYLTKLYNSEIYKKYSKELNIERYRSEISNIYAFLSNSLDQIISLPSRQLAQYINILSDCIELDEDNERIEDYKETIALLCDELINRIKANGEVEKGENNFIPVSFYTNIRCANALINGYKSSQIVKFLDFSKKIFEYVLSYYKEDLSLFIKDYDDKISISIRDIAETLKHLEQMYIINKTEKYLDMILNFYNKAVKTSNIMQNDIIVTRDFEKLFENMNVTTKPPVLLRSVRFNNKNILQVKPSKYVNNQYALYSSYIFLNLFEALD